MKKQFAYKKFLFTISIELFTMVERSLDGKRVRTLTVELINPPDADTNFKRTYPINDNNMAAEISAVETEIQKWVDSKKEDSTTVKTLKDLGFNE